MMSEHVTHLAVADDCRRLLRARGSLDDIVQEVLEKHPEAVHFGSVTRGGAEFMVDLLDKYRRECASSPGETAGKRLAFVLGWYAHRAADRYFKLIYRQLEPDPVRIHNIRIYHDLVTFREVYDDGELPPFIPEVLEPAMASHPASEVIDVENAESIFGGQYLRNLLELHSFIERDIPFKDWFDRVFAARQYNRMDHMTAYISPDPETRDKLIDAPNFYDPTDPIIEQARSIQSGGPNPSISLDDAVEGAINGSQYAQALNLGIRYLQAANDYFAGDITRDELEYRVDLSPMPLFEGEFDHHQSTERATTRLNQPGAGDIAPAGYIAPIAATDDCRRLAGRGDEVIEPIVSSLDRHPDAARIGGALRSPATCLPSILESFRDQWPTVDDVGLETLSENGIKPERLAFVAGALCQGAATIHLPRDEDTIRRDTIILKGVAGPDGDTGTIDVEDMSELLDAFWRRTLLRIHTLNPDTDDIEGWMDRLFEIEEQHDTLIQRYVELYCSLGSKPDPSVYDPSDAVIELARSIYRDSKPDGSIESVLATEGTSRYANALKDGYRNLAIASQFLEGEIDELNGQLRL